jgi:hypothetical protein
MEPEGASTEFTKALHLFLSLARPIQSTSLHPTSLRFIHPSILTRHERITVIRDCRRGREIREEKNKMEDITT